MISYHKMIKKTTSHIDTSIKVCYDCSSTKVVFIVDKKYNCTICALNNQQGYNNGNRNKRKERGDTRRKSSYC